MKLRLLIPALLLVTIFAAQLRGETATTGDATSEKAATAGANADGNNVDRPAETAHRVFEGAPFWWKHRSKVADPTRELGILERLREPFKAAGSFFAKVLGRIFQFLSWLMPTWTPSLGVAAGLSTGLVWGLGAIAVAVVAVIIYRELRRRRWGGDSFTADRLEEPERLPDALVLIARAKAALEAGDTFEALRLGFQAVLAALEDRGIVRYDPARTNSEYARDLRPQPHLATDFRRIALPFDRAFYGRIRPEKVDVERALEFCQSLMTAGAVST
jgi:hypothetical protein